MDKSEFDNMMNMGKNGGEGMSNSNKATAIMNMYDEDKDGLVTKDEFIQASMRMAPPQTTPAPEGQPSKEEMLGMAFAMLDVN